MPPGGGHASGEVFPLARNDRNGGDAEFCGPTFSPDERMLFANLQGPGSIIAIEGPFAELA